MELASLEQRLAKLPAPKVLMRLSAWRHNLASPQLNGMPATGTAGHPLPHA
jgi:hypothetical protein